MSDDARSEPAGAMWPLIEVLQDAHRRRSAQRSDGEGLRERKKRLMRQNISDVATRLFLERGFDAVRVAEVAAAASVSEKTVFNYFPTKESLLLDREDDMAERLRAALGAGPADRSPVDAMVATIEAEVTELTSYWEDSHLPEMSAMRAFTETIQASASLRAAQMDMMERLAQVATEAMASRAGVSPDEPEPRIAGEVLLGLWHLYFRSLQRYADPDHSPAEVRSLVMADVRRAARLVDSGLWSFGLAVQGSHRREQIDRAAAATDDARRQVQAAIRQARRAWRGVGAEPPAGVDPSAVRAARAEHVRQAHQEMAQAMRDTKRAARAAKQVRRSR